MTEQDKVTVDDIIGIVKTEEQTNSVEEVRKLRGRENKTAKRFMLSDFFWEVLDTKYDWLGNTEPFSEEVIEEEDYLLIGRARTQDDGEDICKLLNKLVEENKQLKEESEVCKQAYDEIKSDAINLKKENEELKQQNKMLRTNVGKLTDDVKYLRNLPSIHQKENEQLKHQLQQQELEYATTCHQLAEENESLKEEIKFLQNKVATYKKGNALLKSTMDKEWK